MSSPALSVIVPLYRQLHWLREALSSVQQDGFEDWEALLVDDGSPVDPRPLIAYLQQHQTWLQSVLSDGAQLGRLQVAVTSASADANGLQQSLQAMNRDAASLNSAGQNIADLPLPPSPSATIDQFRNALDRLTASLGSIEQPQPGLDKLLADRGMTLTELSDRVGVSVINLSILKNGHARAIGNAEHGDLGDVGLVGDAPDLLAVFQSGMPADDRAGCVVETRSHPDRHVVRLADLDGTRVHDLGADSSEL